MMTYSKKTEITLAMRAYIEENGLTQEEMAKLAGLNISYINSLMQMRQQVNGSPIKDMYYRKIANIIGVAYDTVYWDTVETPQYDSIMTELADSKSRGYEKLIIGDTGCGKTYAVNEFKRKYPQNTYCITVSNLYYVNDILGELCDVVGVQTVQRPLSRVRDLSKQMHSLRQTGRQPIIIIDEAENLNLSALRMIKALYDAVAGACPIVLIGTNQLLKKIDHLRKKDFDGIQQLYRRFKAGIRLLDPVRKDMYEPFLEKVDDLGARELLVNISDNYGELNRYLEPALRDCEAMGESLDEKFLMNLYKL